MTYVRQQTSEELAAHMRYLQGLPGWHDPLADRLWQEVEALRAEVAGLRTGYEAYERVNAELKAENDALRKDAERYDWLKINSSVMLKKTATYTTGLGRINTIYPAGSELDLCLDAAMGKGDRP